MTAQIQHVLSPYVARAHAMEDIQIFKEMCNV